MKAKRLFLIFPILIAAFLVTSVLAAYLGPDRTRTVTHSVCHVTRVHLCNCEPKQAVTSLTKR